MNILSDFKNILKFNLHENSYTNHLQGHGIQQLLTKKRFYTNFNFSHFQMLKARRFSILPWFFFIFAATIAIPIRDNKKVIKFVQCIPQILSLLFIFQSSYELIQSSLQRPKMAHFYVAVWLGLIPNVIMIFSCIFHKNTTERIHRCLTLVFDKMEHSFELEIEMSSFKQNFRLKMLQNISLFVLLYVLKSLSYQIGSVKVVSPFSNVLDILYFVQTLYRLISILYSILFIDLLAFSLKVLNSKLDSIWNDLHLSNAHALKLREVLHCVKKVHYDLHVISQLVSQVFGWFIVTIFLYSVSTIVTNAFWTFIYIAATRDFSAFAIIRNYN